MTNARRHSSLRPAGGSSAHLDTLATRGTYLVAPSDLSSPVTHMLPRQKVHSRYRGLAAARERRLRRCSASRKSHRAGVPDAIS